MNYFDEFINRTKEKKETVKDKLFDLLWENKITLDDWCAFTDILSAIDILSNMMKEEIKK